MDTHSLPALDIEGAASSTPLAAADVNDRSERFPTPETTGRAVERWLVDTVLLAGAAAAALYGGIWRDPTTFPPD